MHLSSLTGSWTADDEASLLEDIKLNRDSITKPVPDSRPITSKQRQWWNALCYDVTSAKQESRANGDGVDYIGEATPKNTCTVHKQITKPHIVGLEGPPLRREYRQLNADERARWGEAVRYLGSTIVDPENDPDTSQYDLFVRMHQTENAPFAHGGPAFLAWHREFLFRFVTNVVYLCIN